MAINVHFQNLAQANIEILKAFNSANSAKALEAYQPLSTKERKLQKLRALQLLKQSSESETLADISLNTSSLSIALTKAEGATLQAMLNLLSAKMIEQNKYSFYSEDQSEAVKKRIQEKIEEKSQEEEKNQDQNSKQEDAKEEKDKDSKQESVLQNLVETTLKNLKEFQEEIQKNYSQFLDNFSQENLKKLFNDSIKLVTRYAYEVPIESFKEFVLEPIQEFRSSIRNQLSDIVRGGFKTKSSESFSHKEIRSMLKRTLDKNKEDKLQKSINDLNRAMLLKKKIQSGPTKKFSSEELRLALHK